MQIRIVQLLLIFHSASPIFLDQTPASAKPPKGAPDDGVDSLEDAWTYQEIFAKKICN